MSTRAVPTQFSGFQAIPKGLPVPTELRTVALSANDGINCRVTELRWDLAEFEVPEVPECNNGWFKTIELELSSYTVTLEQRDSVFFTSPAAASCCVGKRLPPKNRTSQPKWIRNAQRLWPELEGEPIPLIFEFTGTDDAYHCFGRPERMQFAVYAVRLHEQSIEEHYRNERSDA
jgi:hypothetical protein